jgi:hypothetical protein
MWVAVLEVGSVGAMASAAGPPEPAIDPMAMAAAATMVVILMERLLSVG